MHLIGHDGVVELLQRDVAITLAACAARHPAGSSRR
jgi:hypothetical protein